MSENYLEKCQICKYEWKSVDVSPCDTCKWANSANNWEPKERPKPKRKDLGKILKRMDELAERHEKQQEYYYNRRKIK